MAAMLTARDNKIKAAGSNPGGLLKVANQGPRGTITSYLRKSRFESESGSPGVNTTMASVVSTGSTLTDRTKQVITGKAPGRRAHTQTLVQPTPTSTPKAQPGIAVAQAPYVKDHGTDSEHEHDPDLETPILMTGSEWADANDEVIAGNSGMASWSKVVSRKSPHMSVRESSASDFVIADKDSVRKGHPTSLCGRGGRVAFSGLEMQHKSTVEPVFLAYNCISTEGSRISLMQVALSVVTALSGDEECIDAVQPMQTGWWIYLRTRLERDRLVAQGLVLMGKHIPL